MLEQGSAGAPSIVQLLKAISARSVTPSPRQWAQLNKLVVQRWTGWDDARGWHSALANYERASVEEAAAAGFAAKQDDDLVTSRARSARADARRTFALVHDEAVAVGL